jgi:hypothetical protein
MTRPARHRETIMKITILKTGNIKKILAGCPYIVDEPAVNKK